MNDFKPTNELIESIMKVIDKPCDNELQFLKQASCDLGDFIIQEVTPEVMKQAISKRIPDYFRFVVSGYNNDATRIISNEYEFTNNVKKELIEWLCLDKNNTQIDTFFDILFLEIKSLITQYKMFPIFNGLLIFDDNKMKLLIQKTTKINFDSLFD